MMRTNEHDQEAPMNQSARREGVGEPQCALAASNGGHRGALMAIVIALALSASARSQCQYESFAWRPQDCGWWGFTGFVGYGLNDHGAWCGYRQQCATDGDVPIYCSPDGMPQVLPMPPGASAGGAQATAVNNSGVVVGFKYVGQFDEYRQGVIWWPDGSVETIPPAPGFNNSRAVDINESGVIIGTSGGPYVLDSGVMTHIPDPGLGGGAPRQISNAGHVVGEFGSESQNTAKAFIWRDGEFRSLEPLRGYPASLAFGVNDLGVVAGVSAHNLGPPSGYLHAPTIWIDGEPTLLPLPPGYEAGACFGINNAGSIVGFARPGTSGGGGLVRVIWIAGQPYLMNDLLTPGSPPVGEVRVINHSGQMLTGGGPRLLTPTWSSPMDLNDDCAVDGSDLGVLLASWGAPDFDARCDFNGDGIVDGHDLGTLLGAWTVHR